MIDKIREAVDALPEKYQQVYGHPELSDNSSRICQDRERLLTKVICNLQNYSGKKKLKILDIGCAQGYYSFTAAKLGCEVNGIDYLEQNIKVCQLLKEEQGIENCSFERNALSMEYIADLSENYDIVFALSIMHHVATQNGFAKAREILEQLSAHCQLIITEMAVKEEPLYWNQYLPSEYESWFENISFFDEISYFETHLSDVRRPLIISSNKYVYINDRFYPIDTYSNRAYDIKPRDTKKRYYRSNDYFIKLIRAGLDDSKKELDNEIQFLKSNQDLGLISKVYESDVNAHRSYLIRKYIPGQLIWDIVSRKESCNWDLVFLSLLEELTEMEHKGYYHGDLRQWNIVCDTSTDRGSLIDFGNIQTDTDDHVANKMLGIHYLTVYDAYMTLVYDVLTRREYDYIKEYNFYEPGLYYDLTQLEERYIYFFKAYLLKREQINYEGIKELFRRFIIQGEKQTFTLEEESNILSVQIARSHKVTASRTDLRAHEIQNGRIITNLASESDSMRKELKGDINQLKTEEITRIRENAEEEKKKFNAEIENLREKQLQNEQIIIELKDENRQLKEEMNLLQNWIVLRLYKRLRNKRNVQ